MMDRRDFVKFIALMAAGVAAAPEQIAAYEHYYDVNAPRLAPKGLIAVDEIWISGLASCSTAARLELVREPRCVLHFGLNLYGGVVRWAAMADQKILAPKGGLVWDLTGHRNGESTKLRTEDFCGQISYIDPDGCRQYQSLAEGHGVL